MDNSKPTIVVGDIHGMPQVVDKVLEREQPVVFIGDYLDSYDKRVLDQVLTLRKVLEAVDAGKAEALMGNHELSYLHPHMRCSGFKQATDDGLQSDITLDSKRGATVTLREAMRELLQPYVQREGFLISHAGVSNALLEHIGQSLTEYLDNEKFMDIGRVRGGPAYVGGLYWCDWNHEFEPVPGVAQIVGHTHNSRGELQSKGNNFCIDVLPYHKELNKPKYQIEPFQATVVEIQDGKLTELQLDFP